jgi:hypothetical protein
MADADDSLDLLIRVKSDTAGAAGATAALSEATGAQAKGTVATGEATRATEKHTVGLHAMHKVFHALNEVVPGLGVVMQAAFSPIGATISLAVLALQLFREHMKKVNEEMDKMEAESAKPLTNRLEAMRESVVRNAVGMAELKAKLADAARGQQTLATETERAVAAMRGQTGEAEALGQAQKSIEIAMLDNFHTAGLLSEEQYVEQKLAIEQAYLEKKRDMEERQEKNEITIRRRALEQAKTQEPELTEAAKEAERKKTKALEDLASYDKGGVDERHKETQKKLKEFEAAHNDEVGWFEQAGGAHATRDSLNETMRGLGRAPYGSAQFGNFDQWQSMKWAADQAEKDWNQAPGEVVRREADAATRQADRAFRKAEENEKFIADQTRDLEERRGRLDTRHDTNEGLSEVERRANKLKTPVGALATKDAAEAEATGLLIERRKPVSKEAAEQLREVGSAIAGHNVSLQTAVQMMHWARQNNETVVTTATRLADAMMGLVGDHSQLKGKVAMLEEQINQLRRMPANTFPGN